MNIITAGCSFTKYKWACWPNFVKWFEPQDDIINLGNSASSNETIGRTVYNAVSKYKNIKKVYVMWSGPNRYEVVSDTQGDKTMEGATWSTYDPDWKWFQYYGGHVNKDKHNYYQKYFLNEKQNEIRLLEKILFTQLLLDKHKIEYKMMCYMSNILSHDTEKMSNGHRALYKQINWNSFIFYKDKLGLYEFAKLEYPKEFAEDSDQHPLPLVHYKWVKDIMYQSNIEPPKDELDKLLNFKDNLSTTG